MTSPNPQNIAGQPVDGYAPEAAERWPEQFAESQRRLARLTREQQAELADVENSITQRASMLMQSGEVADSTAMQSLVAEHYRWVCAYWTPTQDAYIGLGDMYVSDERFKARYERVATGLAEYLRDAMRQFAFANLA